MIKDYSSWAVFDGAAEGSGRSEKLWLTNPETCETGLFKYPKIMHNGECTTEHFSEIIASEIAKLIDIPHSRVEIGVYNARMGSMCYKINHAGEELIEGISLINKLYPNYDSNLLYDSQSQLYYCIDMLMRSVAEYQLKKELLSILVFDFLIGNSDRHQNNWAIIRNSESIKISPIYDNGSSLACYVGEDKIPFYLGKDKIKLASLIDTKSRSRVRIDGKIKKEPSQLEMLVYLYSNYKVEVSTLIKTILDNINEKSINDIVEKHSYGILSDSRKSIIKLFLLEKVKLISKVYKEEG